MLLNPFVGTSAVGSSGGVSYFFEERFEGAGYQNTWSETGTTGTANEDYTTSPLEGAQSLLLSGTTQKALTTTTFGVDQPELWGFFKLRIDTALSANRPIFILENSVGTQVGQFTLRTDNALTAQAGSVGAVTTVDALVTGSNYNIWIHFLKGSGANAQFSVGFSTGTTEVTSGNAFAGATAGNSVTDAHTLTLAMAVATNTTGALVFDQVLLSTTGTIGNNPA